MRGERGRGSPQSAIHGCSSPRDDLGDKDPRVVRDVWIVHPPSDAEAQPRVALQGEGVTMRYEGECTHTYTHAIYFTNACTHAPTHTCKYTHPITHRSIRAHTYTYTNIYVLIHVCTSTSTHTHSHTHTHTHTLHFHMSDGSTSLEEGPVKVSVMGSLIVLVC